MHKIKMKKQVNKKIWKGTLFVLSIVILFFTFFIRQDEIRKPMKNKIEKAVFTQDAQKNGKQDELAKINRLLPEQERSLTSVPRQIGNHYIIIMKRDKTERKSSLTDHYEEREIILTLTGKGDRTEKDWQKKVIRVNNGSIYVGIPEQKETEELQNTGNNKESANSFAQKIKEIMIQEDRKDLTAAISYEAEDRNDLTESYRLKLNQLYVPTLYETKEAYFIDLRKPKEQYEKVLVIDAGHGGRNPGTYTKDQKYIEKDLNLAIVKELKKFLDMEENWKVYYTRLEEETVYLNSRVNLANDAQADFFISIHCNAYRDSSAYGIEALYYELEEEEGFGSEELATICLEEITKLIGMRNRGLKFGSDTYIIKKAQIPSIIIEVGYLTNFSDLKVLRDKEKQKIIAEGIYNGIKRAYREKNHD